MRGRDFALREREERGGEKNPIDDKVGAMQIHGPKGAGKYVNNTALPEDVYKLVPGQFRAVWLQRVNLI